jgi:trans-aconitate 2-methyltransferase
MWDPAIYGRYADERARPFYELMSRVGAKHPRYVVDAGCGPGELTAELAARWPEAEVHGFDSSPAMIAQASQVARGPSFAVGDVRFWRPDRSVDVLVSNAVLHWVPEHRELLPHWVDLLSPGGWLAVQVPGNFGAPSHTLVRELCRSAKWWHRLGDLVQDAPVDEPADYLDLLAGRCRMVDVWETTYLHVLPGEDAVLNWIKGTALRPVLDRLDERGRADFLDDAAELLAEAYPRKAYGTPFAFRRIFAIAQR